MPPTQLASIKVRDEPGWITFTIDGRYAYPSTGDVIEAAKKKFAELQMHQTKDRNSILFYLAIESKSFAVWGDEGIHQKVNEEFWKSISDCAISYFKNNDLISGLEKSIEMCGDKLKMHFPLAIDDKNELSNEISY